MPRIFGAIAVLVLCTALVGCHDESAVAFVSDTTGETPEDGATPDTDGDSGDDSEGDDISRVCDPYEGPAVADLEPRRGALHEHTSYSDGAIHATPHDAFKAGAEHGLDFMMVSDHSDTLNRLLYFSIGSECFESLSGLLRCFLPAPDGFSKWQITGDMAAADTTADFVAVRGFEWTSDRFGHINVFFSSNFTNAKFDGGYLLTMDPFWRWLVRAPGAAEIPGTTPLGGGADGLGIFNHPGDKCLGANDSACNWNSFAHEAFADEQMVGMELYNDNSGDDRYARYYGAALDAGWHVGAVGGEDVHDASWGEAAYGKTVILAPALDESALKSAMKARRMYALAGSEDAGDLRIAMRAEGHPMGARLECMADMTVPLTVEVERANGLPFDGTLELYSGPVARAASNDTGLGLPLASASGNRLNHALPVLADSERWYFVRVANADGKSLAYTSPVWVQARQQ